MANIDPINTAIAVCHRIDTDLNNLYEQIYTINEAAWQAAMADLADDAATAAAQRMQRLLYAIDDACGAVGDVTLQALTMKQWATPQTMRRRAGVR